jgi:general secretion pathway protein D
VLVVSDRASNIARLVAIINRIDLADTDEIEVIPLQYASASEVVRVVSSLLQQTDPKGGQVPGQPVLASDDRTNSVLLAGDKPARLRLRAIIAHLDTPLESIGDTQVIFLKYADAKDLVTILQGATQGQEAAQQPKTAGAAAKQGIDIQADEATNALIITAPPAIQRSLASVIRQLDIPRAQVLIEAIIAEVGTDLTNELGVQFGALPNDDSGFVGGTNFGGPGRSIVSIIANPQLVGPGLTLGVGDLSGNQQWAVLINALARDAATNILSTPTLVTMDNAEAEIIVGQEVPFVTGSFTTSVDTGGLSTNPFQTVERQDVGVILRVKPQINEGDALKLELEQEVSSVAPSSAVVNDLVTNRRSIKTTVMAEDEQVVVLGGLIEDRFRDSEEKVPLLGDIPVVGNLFRYDTTTKTKQNLMVFIHPIILRDQLTANHYTEQKYSVLRARQIEAEIAERGLIRGEDELLPDLQDLITPPPPGATPSPAGSAPAGSNVDPDLGSPVSSPPAAQDTEASLPRIVIPPATPAPSPERRPAGTGIDGLDGSQWLAGQDPNAYTVQLAAGDNAGELNALYLESGADAPAALTQVADERASWYVLVSGVYANTADAQAAIERLPLSLQRYRPWIRRISDVQASMDARPWAERR